MERAQIQTQRETKTKKIKIKRWQEGMLYIFLPKQWTNYGYWKEHNAYNKVV